MVVILATMLFYLGLSFWAGLPNVKEASSNFPVRSHLSTIIVLVLLGWLLRGFRWHFYVKEMALPISFGTSMLAFLASFALTATPGKSGEAVKAGLLYSRYRVPIAKTTGILFVERLGDLVAVSVLSTFHN